MNCPECNSKSKVVDMKTHKDDNENHRKRICPKCGKVFYSVEYEVLSPNDFNKLRQEYNSKRRCK